MKRARPRIDLLAIDLDGTLLAADKSLSAANIEAVQRARDQGIRILLVSARPPFGITPYAQQLGSTEILIAYNGAYVTDMEGEQVLLDRPLPRPFAQWLVEIIRRYELYTGYYAAMEWFVEKVCSEMHWEAQSLNRQPEVVEDLTVETLPRPHKLIVIELEQPEKLAGCFAEIRQALPHVNAHFSSHRSLEISDEHASKGTALAHLAGSMDLAREAIAAIGDGENDLSMLQFAGTSVAVANAQPAVLEAVDFVVASHEESGVAEAIERLLDERKG
jgi:Cof subfamily protein (haloacid dehalogenase superfamily)